MTNGFEVSAIELIDEDLLALVAAFVARGGKLFATGTGSDASPGLLVFEGAIDLSHIATIFNA